MRALLFLLVFPLFLLASCQPYQFSVDSSLADVKSSNRLNIGYQEKDFFSYTDAEGDTLRGLDIALAKEVVHRMGVRIRFREVSTTDAVSALDDVYIDIYWSGLILPASVTDRTRSMIFSDFYYTQGSTKYAAGFQITAGALRREVNRILTEMKNDGTLATIIAQNNPD